jgi:hypothetical protein
VLHSAPTVRERVAHLSSIKQNLRRLSEFAVGGVIDSAKLKTTAVQPWTKISSAASENAVGELLGNVTQRNQPKGGQSPNEEKATSLNDRAVITFTPIAATQTEHSNERSRTVPWRREMTSGW